ncbi:hypothetical protein ACH4VR_36095 [Streptomyces sp. NPDC020883]|uniref:hypothetical protein n=1 Tax=Streptomyces sp. NPDC020883 TaxID=3365099 RepID=UPI0037A008C7
MARRRACTIHVRIEDGDRTAEWTETFCAQDIRDGLANARHQALKDTYAERAATITRVDFRIDHDGNRID